MDRNIILCIGSVTAKQYGRARPDLLRRGIRNITVSHVKPRPWLCARVVNEEVRDIASGATTGMHIPDHIMRTYFLPIYRAIGPKEFREQLDRGGWLEWFIGIKPREVRAVVFGAEEDFDTIYDESVRNIIESQVLITWPNGIDVYVIGENGEAFKEN